MMTVAEKTKIILTMAAIVVGSRLHWNNHARRGALDVSALLDQVLAFFARAASYPGVGGVLLAVGIPEGVGGLPPTAQPTDDPDRAAFNASVTEFLDRLYAEAKTGVLSPGGKSVPVVIVPLVHWGQFVPALNAMVSTAAMSFPSATLLLLQSLEIEADAASVGFLHKYFDLRRDLVVGAALPGHEFSPANIQPLNLTGTTSPWNTLALWNLPQLSKVGFPLVGDGLHIDGEGMRAAGIEEVATIAMYQQLYPVGISTRATVVRVPGIAWQVDELPDPERRAWQAAKMVSKNQRAGKQMARLGIQQGRVYHVEVVKEST